VYALVTGDFHITRSRLKELSNILDQIQVLSRSYPLLFILGDVFDTSTPTAEEIDVFIKFLKGIPLTTSIYLISGNHDKGKINSLIWSKRIHPNLIFSPDELSIVVKGKQIVLKHSNVSESKIGPNEVSLGNFSYKSIQADILLLGHIHKPQVISEKPLVLHPGSPYYINFGERNDNSKGVFKINIEDLTYKFIPLKVIPMSQYEFKNAKEAETTLQNLNFNHKVKVIFSLDSYTANTLVGIKDIISKYRQRFVEFKYDIKTSPSKVKGINKTKQINLKTLFNQFCTEKKVDKTIRSQLQKILEI